MPRTDISIQAADGLCPSHVFTPTGDGPWPAVIFFMDAGGVRPSLLRIAERLADNGYYVLFPEMYYRSGPYAPFDVATVFTDQAERARLTKMITVLTKEAAARDTGAFLDFLSKQPQVAGTKVGCTGYCMGGSLSLTAAGTFPDRIAAAASFHGGHLATDAPDSPHRLAGKIKGRVYVAAAENDSSFPEEQKVRLEEALTGAGVDHEIEVYKAAHGFAVDDMPVYDRDAAERHWRAMLTLFRETLGH